jgi:hypothetical protein
MWKDLQAVKDDTNKLITGVGGALSKYVNDIPVTGFVQEM